MLFYATIVVSYAVGFIFMVSMKIRSVETIRNVLILKVIVKINKEIVHALINC
jgi:hypothetical protein